MRQVIEWEGWELRLLPAGHIIGSAMLHLMRKADGAALLYTGDYKLRQGLSSERCELLQADTLIMECTFGLPQYAFPPLPQIVTQVLKWVTGDPRGWRHPRFTRLLARQGAGDPLCSRPERPSRHAAQDRVGHDLRRRADAR